MEGGGRESKENEHLGQDFGGDKTILTLSSEFVVNLLFGKFRTGNNRFQQQTFFY